MNRRPIFAACTAVFVFGVFLAFVANPGVWRHVGVLEVGQPYADLIAVLSAGEAHAAGYDVHVENPRDPFGRTHVYGPLWLHSAALGFRIEDASWLGPLLVAVFIAAAVAVLAPGSATAMAGAALLLLSPPVLLGMERANNDLVIFLLLGLAAAFIHRGRIASVMTSGILAVAGLLKFYPIVAVAALLGAGSGRIWRVGLMAGASLAFGLGWLLQYREYEEALLIAPRPISIFAYGIGLLPASWSRLEETRFWLGLGFFPVVGLGAWLVWSLRHVWWNLLSPGGCRAVFAVMTGLAWICCYALTLSFPYRAVLLVPWFAWWWRSSAGTPGPQALAACLLAVFWLGSPKLFIVSNLDRIPGSDRLISALSGVEQAVLLSVTVIVALSVGGWLVREWKAEAPGHLKC